MTYLARQPGTPSLPFGALKQSTGSPKKRRINWLHVAIHAIMIAITLTFVLPIVIVIAGSFSSEAALVQYGYSVLPRQFTLYAYQYLLIDPSTILNAYKVSIISTIVGTAVSLTVMSMLAYAISRKDFSFRKPITFFTFFTLLFNGGLVATYIWMTDVLNVQDSYVAYILPYLCMPIYVLLLRTYFSQLPSELVSAAKIDGANEWQIFTRIIVPLSRPALATVGLLMALVYWNDWWQPLLYVSNPSMYSLQYLLYEITQSIYALTQQSSSADLATIVPPSYSVQMAMAVIGIGPIIIAFLFTQRYFLRGLTLGVGGELLERRLQLLLGGVAQAVALEKFACLTWV